MKRSTKILALLLALVMCVGMLSACGGNNTSNNTPDEPSNNTTTPDNTETQKNPTSNETTPLVLATAQFSSKFSPFFATQADDQQVVDMTQVSMLSSDRTGAIIMKGIEGETREYNGTEYTYYGIADCEITENDDGTVYYDFTMRDDIVYSDGEPMTIDDYIFSMYVVCDPTYDGSTTLSSQPILGMEEYRSGMSTLSKLLAQLGEDNTDFSLVTEEQQSAFWAAVNEGGVAFAQEIVDFLVAAGYNAAEDSVATCAANWGFGLAEDATVKDFFLAIGDAYDWNFSSMEAETAGTALADLIPADVYSYSTMGIATGESAPNIAGIQKTGDYSVRIVSTEVAATLIYQLTISPSPMHYYGDPDLYDYDNNMFGFPKGDLSIVREKTTQPLGAGPYKFVKFENGVVSFEANENYYKGEPKIQYLNFLESAEADKVSGVATGTMDISEPSFSNDVVEEIATYNNGSYDYDGDVITINAVDYLGYGYIGINADNVRVGNDSASEASKSLRKALATILAVYRDVAIDSYYGNRATVINYPISNTSWAAPQATDDGYKVAFSTDVNGNDIYTAGMSDDEKYAAAKTAALGYFEAAGYTVTDGKLTAAPDGASLTYELLIGGSGSGDHPSFALCTLAKEALAELGMELIVTDMVNSSDLFAAMEAGTAELFCAAWSATVDPDMYQIYYSDIAHDGANPGGSNYNYDIRDAELDELILAARQSTDQTYRKLVYKECLDIIIDWAVEVPVYQRQNCVIFSSERINMDTMTPDITTFYGWGAEIENIELNDLNNPQ